LPVDFESRFGSLDAAVADRAIHFAALQVAIQALPEFRFRRTQFVGQAETCLEEPVIDASELTHESAPGSGDLASREPCHAGNHSISLGTLQGDIKLDQSNRCADLYLRVEYADISLLGGREENQDRVTAAAAEHASLLVVVDGMGGHANGARAAEVAQQVILEAFWHTPQPLFDPLGFLHMTLGKAHEEVVKLGAQLPIEHRPRATCAICLVQQGAAWWAHVGDSRVYHLRQGAVVFRTRDHSHVEVLQREGVITAEQAQTHPMRNFVECCLGGDPILPDMSLSRRRPVQPNDVLFVCTDGMWSGLKDPEIAAELCMTDKPLRDKLLEIGERAVARAGAASDNTSGAALRWLP